MAGNGVDLLVEKWLSDPGFKQELQADPEATVAQAGISLSAEEWATLRNVVMATADEALRERISKGQAWN